MPATTEAFELTGPRAITAIRGKMEFEDREDEMAALRELVLKITFDGEQKPAVWCPLGDFFGTAPGVNLYQSLVTGMTEEGSMPIGTCRSRNSAVVELVNEAKSTGEVEFEIVHAPLSRPFDGLGHFHCKWHRDAVTCREDRWPDWVMLNTEGRGRFCGVMLHVWNPRGGWWGEGDEKFFVDGEKFPSTFGTGIGRLFRLCLVPPRSVPASVSLPDDDAGQQGAPVGAALARRRQRSLPEIV